jgi:hypothetical protein
MRAMQNRMRSSRQVVYVSLFIVSHCFTRDVRLDREVLYANHL